MKTYELNAKKENKEKGNAEGGDEAAQPSAAVAAALAQQQAHVQASNPGTRGGNNSMDPCPVIARRWDEFKEWKERTWNEEEDDEADEKYQELLEQLYDVNTDMHDYFQVLDPCEDEDVMAKYNELDGTEQAKVNKVLGEIYAGWFEEINDCGLTKEQLAAIEAHKKE